MDDGTLNRWLEMYLFDGEILIIEGEPYTHRPGAHFSDPVPDFCNDPEATRKAVEEAIRQGLDVQPDPLYTPRATAEAIAREIEKRMEGA